MAEDKKEFRTTPAVDKPATQKVPVVVIEVNGYGSLIIERDLWAKKGGNESAIVRAYGIDPKKIDAINYGETRTREYLNNLPGFDGSK